TRCTCPSDFRSSARSTVTFIEKSASAPLKTSPNQARRPAGITLNARPGCKGDAPAQKSQECRGLARVYPQGPQCQTSCLKRWWPLGRQDVDARHRAWSLAGQDVEFTLAIAIPAIAA